jgi:hypothetical protein
MESTETYRKPSRKMAAALGFFIPPAGMLYVARPGRAAIYLALTAGIATVDLLVLRERHWAAEAAGLLVAIVCAVQAYRFARDFRESAPLVQHGPGDFRCRGARGSGSAGRFSRAVSRQSASMQPSIGPATA